MKKVLSLLMIIVLLEGQALALSGGPVFGGGEGGIAITGTYAGVLIPSSETDPAANAGNSAAIGLFSIGVPDTGVATGSAIVFVDGTGYDGTITGVADPDNDTLQGIVEAASNFTIQQLVETSLDVNGNPVFSVVTLNIFAQGSINTTIAQEFDPATVAGVQTSTGIRIFGTSSLDLFSQVNATTGVPVVSNTVTFAVDGFLQSSTVTTTTISLTTPTNNNNNTGS